jgi:hypothetical protein
MRGACALGPKFYFQNEKLTAEKSQAGDSFHKAFSWNCLKWNHQKTIGKHEEETAKWKYYIQRR